MTPSQSQKGPQNMTNDELKEWIAMTAELTVQKAIARLESLIDQKIQQHEESCRIGKSFQLIRDRTIGILAGVLIAALLLGGGKMFADFILRISSFLKL